MEGNGSEYKSHDRNERGKFLIFVEKYNEQIEGGDKRIQLIIK